jgi:hypothetical protein
MVWGKLLMFQNYDPSKPPRKVSSLFVKYFPIALDKMYSGSGGFADTFFLFPIVWGTFVCAPLFGLVGWLKGVNFFAGWFFCVFFALSVHVALWSISALSDAIYVHLSERSKHKDYLKVQADWYAAAPLRAEAARREQGVLMFNSLMREVNFRQQAPARAAQAQADAERERVRRRTELEAKLAAHFVAFRFRKDWNGNTDMQKLQAAFRQSIRDKPPFSADEMALLLTTDEPNTRLLLPPLGK